MTIVFFTLCGCGGEQVFTPKPRMYPHIAFPEKGVKSYENPACPFTFELPAYAEVSQDRYVFEGQAQNECWFNINIPTLNGTLYCSYIDIDDQNNFDKVIRDAFKIVSEHNAKANYRDERVIKNDQGAGGLAFKISGPVATPFQFYMTDTTDHFFRASLYFNNKVEPDSMAPIHQFVIEDMEHLISTFEWKS